MHNMAFIFPRLKYPSGDPPLGIAYIASQLIKNNSDIKIDIIDTTFVKESHKYISHYFRNKEYDLIGFSVMTSMLKDALDMAAIIKMNDRNSKIIFGGPHPTVAPEFTLKNENIDAICIGEGEKTIIDLVKSSNKFEGVNGIWFKQNGKIIKNSPRKPIENLDDLEFPARDLMDMKRYSREWSQLDAISYSLKGTGLIASRGCPYRCSFCQPTLSSIFGETIRKRSPENIVKEIILLKERYKIDAFLFLDDTLVADKNWILTICNEIIKNNLNIIWGCNIRANLVDQELLLKMKKAGLRKVMMGIESGSQRILDSIYDKGITIQQIRKAVDLVKKLDLRIQGYFMIGAPSETEEEIRNTIKFAKNLNIDEATFSVTTPLPCTYLYDRSKDLIKQSFENFDYYKVPVYGGKNILPSWKIRLLKKRAFIEFYLSKKRIFRSLKSLFSHKTLNKLKRF